MRACISVCVLAFGVAGLAGCGTPAVCRAPLSQAECDDAIAQADEALEQDSGMFTRSPDQPLRLTVVWKACTDEGCMDHLAGFASVRVATEAGDWLGRVVVCIDESLCAGAEPQFAFP